MSTTETHANGSVTYWLTLPGGKITTGKLAEWLISELPEDGLQSLVEMLCDG